MELQTLATWLPIIGSIFFNGATMLWGYAKLGSKVDTLAEAVEKQESTNEKACNKQELKVKELEVEIGLRITTLEKDQSELRELLYKKIESVADGVNDIKEDFIKFQSYIQGRDEGSRATSPTARRPRRKS